MDEDFFDDDDGLDNLPPNTLQDLENRALRSTQLPQPVAEAQKPPSSDYGLGDDEEVIDLDAHPQANVITARQPSQDPLLNPLSQKRAPPTQRAQDEVTQREQWRLQRYGAVAQQRLPAFKPPRLTQGTSQGSQPSTSQKRYGTEHESPPPQPAVNGDVDAEDDAVMLQARITELERLNAALARENQEVKADAYSRAGEIAIVRSNQAKAAQDYERKLSTLQEQHAQEAARHKAEMEAARKDREKMETSNKFLEHDLAQEAARARNAPRSNETQGITTRGRASVASPAATPKKGANLPFRDGFNDDEVVVISPSRSKEKSKPSTPTKAATKRKRSEQDNSPANGLSFSDSDTLAIPSEQNTPPGDLEHDLPIRPTDEPQEVIFDFVQCMLEHRQRGGRRTIECLSRLHFPSSPSIPMSSFVYDALRLPSVEDHKHEADFCSVILELWSRCLRESIHEAIPIFTSLVEYVVADFDENTSASIVTKLVPIAVQTADLVATPKARAWAHPTEHKGPLPEVERHISPLHCLQLLHMVTLNCYGMQDALRAFWSIMEHDFVLVMLYKAQPVSDSIEMLDLLTSSVLPDTFGAINTRAPTNDEDLTVKQRQDKYENDLISRLANLLVDQRDYLSQPEKDNTSRDDANALDINQDDVSDFDPIAERNKPAKAVHELHLATLGLLTRLCSTERGGKLLASHRLVTGRIIRLLHESLLSMYDYNPYTHESTTACVNESVMVLAHLCFVHGETLKLREKLAAEHGGHQKHLVSLSRVAFSSGESVIEEGIWSETAEAAHRMLDEFLSPEEGDAVVSVFSSSAPYDDSDDDDDDDDDEEEEGEQSNDE